MQNRGIYQRLADHRDRETATYSKEWPTCSFYLHPGEKDAHSAHTPLMDISTDCCSAWRIFTSNKARPLLQDFWPKRHISAFANSRIKAENYSFSGDSSFCPLLTASTKGATIHSRVATGTLPQRETAATHTDSGSYRELAKNCQSAPSSNSLQSDQALGWRIISHLF